MARKKKTNIKDAANSFGKGLNAGIKAQKLAKKVGLSKKTSRKIGDKVTIGVTGASYKMTAARKAALKKAQQASAAARRKFRK
jgi:transposase